MIRILHPDPGLREAFARTLASLWPEMTFEAGTEPAAGTLSVWLGERAVTAVGQISLAFSATPPRASDIVWQLQQAHARLRWPAIITIGKATLDTGTRVWTVPHNAPVELTEKEVALLVHLSQAQSPVTRAQLLRNVWRYAADAETHTIETHIHRLRQKIETDPNEPTFLVTTKDGYTLGKG